MNYLGLDYYQQEALYLHISSIVNAPFKQAKYNKLKANTISWKVTANYSGIKKPFSGIVTAKQIAELTSKLLKERHLL